MNVIFCATDGKGLHFVSACNASHIRRQGGLRLGIDDFAAVLGGNTQ